jgi:hypothetical protein
MGDVVVAEDFALVSRPTAETDNITGRVCLSSFLACHSFVPCLPRQVSFGSMVRGLFCFLFALGPVEHSRQAAIWKSHSPHSEPFAIAHEAGEFVAANFEDVYAGSLEGILRTPRAQGRGHG